MHRAIPVAPEPSGKFLRDDGTWQTAGGEGGTPSSTVTGETSFGQSSNAGASSDYSRGDHTHGSPTDPVPTHNGLTGPHSAATSVGGKSIPSGGIADAATLSGHTGASAPHSGHVQVAGQIGGTPSSPDVRGLRESGATLLTMGAVADGQYLKRSGTNVIGDSPAGGSNPAWYGVLYSNQNNCDPCAMLRFWNMTAVAGPTPTGITVSVARCVKFRPPANMTVLRVRLFGVGATANLYKFAIYPVGSGTNKLWDSGTVTTVANAWLTLTVSFALTANTDYWFCVTAVTTGTTAGFRSPPAPVGNQFYGADAAPLGNRGTLALPVFAQFAVATGVFPATLPTIVAAAYSGGTTGSVPFALLDSVA